MITLPTTFLDSPALATVAARWRSLLPPVGQAVTRFAPSPTGELHLGHVAHLAWVWAVAAITGARIVVRVEDHDRGRCRRDFERSILGDLAWLGFEPDRASLESLRHDSPSPWRQSDHPERYQAAFDRLRAAGLLYGCTCTRGDLPPPDEDGERRYPGTCRGQPIDRQGRSVVRARLPDEPTQVDDLLHGTIRQHPVAEHGDPVIRDAMGQWTYQFCVAIDDMHDAVNLIVRGEDLRSSTGRQWALAQLLGRSEPFVTVHHPLVLGDDGRKLSKRDGSLAVRAMRERGMSPDAVMALASGERNDGTTEDGG